MHFLSSAAPLALLASTAAAAASILPGAYIVEFAHEDVDSATFMDDLTAANVPANLRMSLSHSPTFHGASIALEDSSAATLKSIQNMAAVSRVWPVRTHKIDSIKHKEVHARVLHQRDAETDTFSTHIMGNVDKLHELGITGTGIKIAEVDTGIDYTHPSLGGGFGPGFKVAFGYDLVGDDYTGYNAPVPDDDPMDCDGHGTHVAGTIGANDALFTGVASNATLGIYKVFGCQDGEAGNAGDDVLIAAFSMAAAEGVDLITSSIGGPPAYSDDAWAIAIQRIVESGTPCVLAAGNDGSEGMMYGSGGASAVGAVAVGAIDNIMSPEVLTEATYAVTDNSTEANFGYTPATGTWGDLTLPLYIPTLDATVADDGCEAFSDDTPDLSGYLVLIRRGTCTFDTKVGSALAKGATNIMIYNNVPGTIAASVTVTNVTVGMVPPETGAAWIAAVQAGADVSVTFTADAAEYTLSVVNDVTGGAMSSFSTWYPTNDLDGRPTVSAPGGNILSTYFQEKSAYAVLSGTSMATPYIAGVMALIKEVKGTSTSPEKIRTLLATTSKPVNWNDNTEFFDFLTPTALQGGGLVDAFAAIYGTLSVDTDFVTVNDTEFSVNEHTLTFTNDGTADATYQFSNIAAPVAYMLDAEYHLVSAPAPDYVEVSPTVIFSTDSVTLAAGKSVEVSVTIAPPAGLDESRIPVYSGWIGVSNAVTNSSDYVLRVPYLGVATSVRSFNVTDFIEGFPAIQHNYPNITDLTVFTSPDDGPYIDWRLNLPSHLVRLDVQSVSDPSLNTLSLFGNSSVSTATNGSTTSYMGSIPGFPLPLLNRDIAGNYTITAWNWTVTTGLGNDTSSETAVPVGGTYRILYRALKMFGDANLDEDYDFWASNDFVLGGKTGYLVY